MISENRLRRLIKKIVRENVTTYRGGAHAKFFAGGDPAFNIPSLEGVDIDVFRIDNNVNVPHYGVTILVDDRPDLCVNMQTFRDEEEAKKFARDQAEHIKNQLKLVSKNV